MITVLLKLLIFFLPDQRLALLIEDQWLVLKQVLCCLDELEVCCWTLTAGGAGGSFFWR